MKMLADHVLVKPETREERSIGQILLPDGADKNWARGEVLGVGEGLYLQNGDRIKPDVHVGDRILYFKRDAIDVLDNNRNLHIIQERQAVAILEARDIELSDNQKKVLESNDDASA